MSEVEILDRFPNAKAWALGDSNKVLIVKDAEYQFWLVSLDKRGSLEYYPIRLSDEWLTSQFRVVPLVSGGLFHGV